MPFKTPEDKRKSKELANELCLGKAYPYNDLKMVFWFAAIVCVCASRRASTGMRSGRCPNT